MAKYSTAKVAQCEEWVRKHGLMEYGGASLERFCEEMDIDNKTYYKWMQVKDEFREAINRARERFKSKLTYELTVSLAEAAKGYEKEQTDMIYIPNADGSPQIRQMHKIVRHYPPNIAAAIFLLTNLDPEHYKNRQNTDVVIKKDDEQQMTIEEIDKEIARLEKLEKGAGQSKDGNGNQQ